MFLRFTKRHTSYIPFWTEFHGISHDALSPERKKKQEQMKSYNLEQKTAQYNIKYTSQHKT